MLLMGLLASLAPGCGQGAASRGPGPSPDRFALQVAGREVTVELAVRPAQRGRGLMGRTSLGADEGMLFLFPDVMPRTFWMRDTLIPLDIIFLDAEGVVLNVAEAPPGVERPGFHSKGPARMVLELNRGWSREHGLEPGAVIEVPEAWFEGVRD
jgi:uncharacterized membrane protein (UPF0127 family)